MFHVGIVGCGGIAQVHAASLAHMSNVQLVACADIRPERAEKMAEKYGCKAYTSFEDMLDCEKLDVVHLCTPHYLHTPMAAQAAEKGIQVFSEKPPVMTWQQWDELQAAAKKVRIGFCFQNRYNTNVLEALKLIEQRTYGDVVCARGFVCWSRGEKYYTESGWRGTWATEGGGALINQSIHTLDLLLRLVGGEPDLVDTRMSNHHLQGVIEVEDTVESYIRCDGKPILFYATTAYGSDAPVLIEVQLEQATLRLEKESLTVFKKNGESESFEYEAEKALGKDYWGSRHPVCIADFYRCLEEGTPFMNDIDHVRVTVETMLKMYEKGKPCL